MSTSNIQHALTLIDEKHREHKQQWQDILKWYRSGGKSPYVPGRLPAKGSEDADCSSSEIVLEPTSAQVHTKSLSMSRTIRPPFVRLPTSLLPRPEVDFYQYGHPERSSSPGLPTPWALHLSPHLEDLSEAESTDSEDLASELEEEDGLDEGDMDLAASREQELWALFGGISGVHTECGVEIVKKGKKRKRAPSQSCPGSQKKPKPAPRVTSKSRPKYSVRSKVTKVSKALDEPKTAKPLKPPKPKPPKPLKPPATQSSRKKYKSKETISDSD